MRSPSVAVVVALLNLLLGAAQPAAGLSARRRTDPPCGRSGRATGEEMRACARRRDREPGPGLGALRARGRGDADRRRRHCPHARRLRLAPGSAWRDRWSGVSRSNASCGASASSRSWSAICPRSPPQLTLDTFAAQYLATGEGTSLPVMRDDGLLGLIGISQLRGIRRSAVADDARRRRDGLAAEAAVAGARRRGVGGVSNPCAGRAWMGCPCSRAASCWAC